MAQAAKFRERVTIYTPGPVIETTFGRKPAGPEASLETWATVTQYQAQPVPDENGKFAIKQKHRIVIRYVNDPAVQYTDRVEWNGKQITVYSVITDAKKTTITIHGYAD